MSSRNLLGLAAVALLAGAVGAGLTLWANGEEHEEEGDEAREAMGQEAPAGSADAALKALAKISEDSARFLALAQVPGGTISSVELESEGGNLLYSFDITVAGKEGLDEVHISAVDGKLLSHEHEGEAEEATEKAGEGKKG